MSSNPPGSLPSMVAPGRRQALVFASRRGKAPAADLVFAPTLACCGGRWTGGGGWTPSTTSNPLVAVSTPGRQPARRWAGLTPKPHHARQPRVALRGSFRLRLASTCNHRPAGVLASTLAQDPDCGRRGGLGPSGPSGPSPVWVCADPGDLGRITSLQGIQSAPGRDEAAGLGDVEAAGLGRRRGRRSGATSRPPVWGDVEAAGLGRRRGRRSGATSRPPVWGDVEPATARRAVASARSGPLQARGRCRRPPPATARRSPRNK